VTEKQKKYLSEDIKLAHDRSKNSNSSEYSDHIKSLTELNWDGNETRGREGEDITK